MTYDIILIGVDQSNHIYYNSGSVGGSHSFPSSPVVVHIKYNGTSEEATAVAQDMLYQHSRDSHLNYSVSVNPSSTAA